MHKGVKMEYIVKGEINGKKGTKFEVKTTAESEQHAIDTIIVKIGAKQGIRKNKIKINEVIAAK